MGLAMAKNIQKYLNTAGYHPLVYTNRTMARGASLEELNGIPFRSIAEVVQKSDIIFSSVKFIGFGMQ
jgi:3-hydroxyisobutyrate dehydrogenase-like beta-hydroxyacid dehydrogenase